MCQNWKGNFESYNLASLGSVKADYKAIKGVSLPAFSGDSMGGRGGGGGALSLINVDTKSSTAFFLQ